MRPRASSRSSTRPTAASRGRAGRDRRNARRSTSALADGHYDLRAIAYDVAGNSTASATNTILVDNTAPDGGLTAPADGATIRSSATVSANPSDGGSGVASIQFQVKGPDDSGFGNLDAYLTSAPWQVSWDTAGGGFADGTYLLRVETTDAVGNSSTSSARTVTVDNLAPTVSMSAPADGAAVTGTVSLDANANDAGSGLDHIEFEYKQTSGSTWSPTAQSWDTSGLADGSYDLHAIAFDLAGNQTTSAAITVTVDNSAPSASLTLDESSPYERSEE